MIEHLTNFVSGAAQYTVPFIVILSIVVFVHEFGHFWIARRCGVRVDSFSIGFGHEIFGWNDKHGTRWKVAWLPLGGYVKMFGDSDPSSATPDENVKAMTDEEKKVAFFFQPVGKRFAVVAAGPLSNYLFAIIVLAGLFFFNGHPYTAPIVDTVLENSVAQSAGLKTGDHIVSIDGQNTKSFEDIKRIIAMNAGTPVSISLERGGNPMVINLTPEVVKTTDRIGGEHSLGRIGVSSTAIEYRKLNPAEALLQSLEESWNLTTSTLRGVGQMIMGTRGTEELGGPIRIAEMSGKVAKEGIPAIFWFLAVISVNLGLINLFPVPLLDGGHLVFYIMEKLRGKPLSEKVQEIGARIGLSFVVCLMVFATWNDLVHLRVISYIIGLFT